jgi:hypothetical protein
MAGNNQYNAQVFIDAIPGTGGIISTIATRVGCAWHTAKKYIIEYPTIQQAYQNEKHQVDDKAVSNIYHAIGKGDLETSKWWVRMKLGDEFAPTEKVKEEIRIVNWDDDNNPD